jgi:hypothetical protein
MSESFVFHQCPNCGRRSLFFSLSIYRCRICYRFCCDRCMKKSVLAHSCPHCEARSSVIQVGYTG